MGPDEDETEAKLVDGDASEKAASLRRQAQDLGDVGELESAKRCLEEALAVYEQAGSSEDAADVHRSLGMLALASSNPDEAQGCFLEALELDLRARNAGNISHDLGYLGHARSAANDHARSVLYIETALALHRSAGNETAILLDLIAQGESLLMLDGQLPAAVACLRQAIMYGEKVEFPRLAEIRLRYESIMGQLSDRFPEQATELERSLEVEAEDLRLEGVHAQLGDATLAVSFFEDQFRIASALDDAGGVFSSLGSQSHSLAEAGELRGGVAALMLAARAAEDLPPAARQMVDTALRDWGSSLLAQTSDTGDLVALRKEVSSDTERIRAEAVASVLRR